MKNILIVDDDKEIVKAIEIYLKNDGYNILKAYDGVDALEKLEINNEIDLVILDVMMPKKDGIEVLSQIRNSTSSYKEVPVIMLSAKSEDIDKIQGLNIGADDYVTKPFNPMELIARVKSILRRCEKNLNKSNTNNLNKLIYQSGGLEIDDSKKEVKVDGKEIKLTPTEYKILRFLTQNKGIVYSIEQIYENVWEEECFGVENIIAVHIRHIREKVEINPKTPKYLKVIWGIGYKIEDIK